MDEKMYAQFMKDQIAEIERHKWIESEKSGRDLGEEVIKQWIETYADTFRKEWIKAHSLK